jgi:hypothetical protein
MCLHIILVPSPQAPNHRFVSFVIGIIDRNAQNRFYLKPRPWCFDDIVRSVIPTNQSDKGKLFRPIETEQRRAPNRSQIGSGLQPNPPPKAGSQPNPAKQLHQHFPGQQLR